MINDGTLISLIMMLLSKFTDFMSSNDENTYLIEISLLFLITCETADIYS